MELFTVTCTTCQSRLKVRERAVIGQILACPKCQGMVLLTPPAGWVDPGDAPPSAAASAVPPPLVKAKPARDEKLIDSNFEDAAKLLAPVALPAANAAPVPEPVAAHGDDVSPAQKMRRWMIAGGLGVAGTVGLIGVAVYAFGGGEPEREVVVAEKVPVEPVAEPKPTVESTAEPDKTTKPGNVVDPQAKEEVSAKPMPSAAPVEPAKEPMTEPKPVATDVPPDLAARNDVPPPDDAPKPLNTFSAENTLKELAPLIEDKPFDPPAATSGDQPLPMAEPEPVKPETKERIDEEPLPRPEPRRIDVARRLADSLDAVELTDMPLADFLQLVTDLSTLPITLEPGTLPAVKASTETKISVRTKKSTIDELLTAALKPHQLTHVVRGGGLAVIPVASSQEQLRQIKHDVSDLAKDDEQVQALADLIQAVIEPASWKAAGGTAELEISGQTLVVSQTPYAHFGLIVLCEKLRLARKLPTRTQYSPEIITLTPRFAAAQPLLDQPVTLNFVPPTRLNKVSDRVRAMTGLRVLVDWQAVAEQDWTPEAEVKVGAANVPLGQFLERLARRMELVYRVVDPHTVQLTTAEALRLHPDVEVYRLTGSDEQILAKLRTALGSDWFSPDLGHALRLDAPSKSLVARVPQPGQKRIAEALAKESP